MRIGHTEAGHGVPLVLLHAFPLNAAMWAATSSGENQDATNP